MPWFVLGILLLIGGLLISRWYVVATPVQLARVARVLIVVFGGALVLWLIVTGRLAFATMALGALLPMIMRLRTLRRMWRNATGPSAGQRSEVGTRFLRMTLDHDTGAMTGTVLQGPFRGRDLGELSEAERAELLRMLRVEDPESGSLLEAYLDRISPEWRDGRATADDGAQAGTGTAGGPMSVEDAYRILGLEPGASETEIRAAHRSLMQKLHPDHGGSTWLAARVNEAKDLLLDGREPGRR